MPRSPGQKQKLLILKQILEQQSDEAHPLTTQQLIAALAVHDVIAERKSIYDDIETLQQHGVDIVTIRGRSNAYYIGSRLFQLPELKLLVDAAQSAKFITEKKSRELIRKIGSLASRHDAALLHRQVYVQGRVKNMNESIYYGMDLLQSAIATDRKIRCQYFEWAVDHGATHHYKKRPRRGGKPYTLSPWAMLWDNENYYLLAFDDASSQLRHYRVDKLGEITLLPEKREGRDLFAKLDMATYTKRRFGMFGGEEEYVDLRFKNRLIGVIVDRFGKDIHISPDAEEGWSTVKVQAVVSPQFIAWVLGLEDEAQLTAPPEAVEKMRGTLERVSRLYR